MTTRHIRNISEDTEFDITYSEWMRITGILVQAGLQPLVDVLNRVGVVLWQVHVGVQVAIHAFLSQLGPLLVVWLERLQHITSNAISQLVPLFWKGLERIKQFGAVLLALSVRGLSFLRDRAIPFVKAWIRQTGTEIGILLNLLQEYIDEVQERIKNRKRVNVFEQILPYLDAAKDAVVQAWVVASEAWQATVTPLWHNYVVPFWTDSVVPKMEEYRELAKVKAIESWEKFQEDMKKENPHIKAAMLWLRPRYNELIRQLSRPPRSHASRAVVVIASAYFTYGVVAIFAPDFAFVMGFGTDPAGVTKKGGLSRNQSFVGFDPVKMVMRQSGVMAILVGVLCWEASKPRRKKLIEVATSINLVLGVSLILFFAVGWMPAPSLVVAVVQLLGAVWLALTLYQDDMIRKEAKKAASAGRYSRAGSKASTTRRRKGSKTSLFSEN